MSDVSIKCPKEGCDGVVPLFNIFHEHIGGCDHEVEFLLTWEQRKCSKCGMEIKIRKLGLGKGEYENKKVKVYLTSSA